MKAFINILTGITNSRSASGETHEYTKCSFSKNVEIITKGLCAGKADRKFVINLLDNNIFILTR